MECWTSHSSISLSVYVRVATATWVTVLEAPLYFEWSGDGVYVAMSTPVGCQRTDL